MGPLPSTPSAPTKDFSTSYNNSIGITWSEITGDVLPIYGYKLYADSGLEDDFELIYDGTNRPAVTSFTWKSSSLDTDLTYRVYLTATNANGESSASAYAYL